MKAGSQENGITNDGIVFGGDDDRRRTGGAMNDREDGNARRRQQPSSSAPKDSTTNTTARAPFQTVLLRSIHEDWPLWMGSLWLVWKNRQQQPQPNHTTTESLKSLPRSSFHSRSSVSSSSSSSVLESLWTSWTTSIPWSLLLDILVVGTVLTYKKRRELLNMMHRPPGASAASPSNDEGERDYDDNKGCQQSNENVGCSLHSRRDNNNGISDRQSDQIDELRRLLMKSSVADMNAKSGEFSATQSSNGQAQQAKKQQHQQHQEQRYIELLVHNVSHTDLVLSLEAPPLPPAPSASFVKKTTDGLNEQEEDDLGKDIDYDDYEHRLQFCLCRPRFSAFDAYSQRVLDYLNRSNDLSTDSLINFPLYERSDEPGERYRIKSELTVTNDTVRIPTGFRLGNVDKNTKEYNAKDEDSSLKVTASELNDLRFRGRDAPRVQNLSPDEFTMMNAVFFPILSTLLPLWKTKIQEKYSGLKVKQVLILVSGVGTPRNYTHSLKGNSTQQCAAIMRHFLKTLYPELVVVHVHSETNIFRYDDNIIFVQKELLPRIQDYRDAHAKGLPYPDELSSTEEGVGDMSLGDRPFSTEWRKSFSVTLSFADGSPARTHAIQAALRSFRPTYFHFWQLKTFWHEMKVVERDIEVHSFEEMETQPPIETTQLHDQPLIAKVVEEMKVFRTEMIEILSKKNDINSFWLRKTHKPVLAVLAVQTKDGGMELFRGTNMEVSMPTGSLCAERNVIGTALARNPALRRQDLKLIAVLAVPNPGAVGNGSTASRPMSRAISTVALANHQRVPSQNSISNSHNYITSGNIAGDDGNPVSVVGPAYTKQHMRPPLIPSRKSSVGNEDDWIQQDIPPSFMPRTGAPLILRTPPIGPIPSGDNLPLPPSFALDAQVALTNGGGSGGSSSSAPPTPTRRIPLYDKTQSKKRTVIVRSDDDMNPLRPCGACNEWLKKIAECNPYFTILTFTDSDCHGVFCQPCQE